MKHAFSSHSASKDFKFAVGSEAWVHACFQDMRRRAASGITFSAKEFFEVTLPEDICVDLIYGEFLIRCEQPEFELEKFISGYRKFEPQLRRQLALDDAFCTEQCKTDQSRSQPIPKRIGKFLVIEELASGSQARVFRALHPELKQDVIVKLSNSTAATNEDPVVKEGQVLAALEHPAIAQVLDVGVHEQSAFLVSRYIRGETLDLYLQRTTLTLEARCRLVAEVARGLAVSHRSGILHLDVKPRNIVVDELDQPKLIDFGLATLRQTYNWEHFETGSLRGTLAFMSPEQASGDGDSIDHRSDIFGLGAVLYFLCVRQNPYRNDAFADLLEDVRNCNWNRQALENASLPKKLEAIICRAMSRVQDDRFASATDFENQLEEFMAAGKKTTFARRTLLGGIAVFGVASICALSRIRLDSQRETIDCPATTELTVEVLRDGDYFPIVDCVPLQTGEALRVRADVPANHFAGLFVLTQNGDFRLLKSMTSEREMKRLRYPESENEAAPLVGRPGTEVFLLCMRHETPFVGDELNKYLGQQKLPSLFDLTVLKSNEKETVFLQAPRDLGEPIAVSSPDSVVRDQLEEYRRTLENHLDHFQAIVFCHVD